MSTRMHIVVTHALLEQIDRARGDVPRSAFVRRAVEQALGSSGRAGVGGRVPALPPAEQPHKWSDPSVPPPSTLTEVEMEFDDRPAPALDARMLGRVRSSAEARPFRPVPKKGEK